MPIIKPYESQISAQTDTGTRFGTGRADAADFLMTSGSNETAKALSHLGETIGKSYDFLKQREEDQEISDAQVQVARIRTEKVGEYQKMQEQHQAGDESFAPTIRQDMSDTFSSLRGKYKSDKARKYVDLHGETTTADFFGRALTYQTHQAQTKAVEDVNARRGEDAKTLAENPALFEMVAGAFEFDVSNGVGMYRHLPDVKKAEIIRETWERYALAAGHTAVTKDKAVAGMIAGTASAQVQKSLPPNTVTTFSTPMDFIFKWEGDKYVASDGASNAPAKFGINQKYHPNIDVSKLTKEGAAAIYKTEYWDKIGGSDLPPRMATVAMNVAVMSGVGVAKQYIEQSNGDPMKVIELHRQQLNRLAQNPNRNDAQYLKGWMNRLDDLTAQVSAMPEHGVSANATVLADTPAEITPQAKPLWWDKLSYQGQMQLTHLAQNQVAQETKLAAHALTQQRSDRRAAFSAGMTLPAPIPDQMYSVYGPDAASKLAEDRVMEAVASTISGMRNASPAEINTRLATLDPSKLQLPPGALSDAIEFTKVAKSYADAFIKQREQDPIKFATNNGFAGVKNFSSVEPATFGVELKSRAVAAGAISQTYGTKLTMLSDDESKKLGEYIKGLPTNKVVGDDKTITQQEWLANVRSQVDQPTFRQLTSELFKDDRSLSYAASIMASPTPSTVYSVASSAGGKRYNKDEIASAIAEGNRWRSQVKQRTKDATDPNARDMPTDGETAQVFTEWLGGAKMDIDPERAAIMRDVATSHFVGLRVKTGGGGNLKLGKDAEHKANRDAFKESLNIVFGKPSKIGESAVLRPFGMEEAPFLEAVDKRVREQDPTLMRGEYGMSYAGSGNKYRVMRNGQVTNLVIDLDQPARVDVEAQTKKEAKAQADAQKRTAEAAAQKKAEVASAAAMESSQTWGGVRGNTRPTMGRQ